ncbi:MAG: acetylglutamate kinase [Candidatus Omnitrophica bacterium CG11_big_fil_rev_8_21_14_0_20_64_10]|nr:MAG: acetylglutamate kinase [Candidatus Omnitrophica bacterium CG11_big_fil_rev_8_21_14_0_20_64_10]
MRSTIKRLAGAIGKASVLLEAMPYLQAFRGKVFVIKTGGNALSEEAARTQLLQDLVFLQLAGIRPVLVHGGGPEISRAIKAAGGKAKFVQGLRVTDRKTLGIVARTLRGRNRSLVKELRAFGGRTASIDCGRTGILETTRRRVGGADIGWVGKIQAVRPAAIERLLREEVIPVVVPMGRDRQGRLYNVNADQAGAALAAGLKAEKFVLVTDVLGVLKDQKNKRGLIGHLRRSEANRLITRGVIQGGMIPKARACIEALDRGVHKTHMIDIRIPHGLLLEIFTFEGIGTEIVHDEN